MRIIGSRVDHRCEQPEEGAGMAAATLSSASFGGAFHSDYAQNLREQAYQAVEAAYADTRWERVRGVLFADWQLAPSARQETMVRRLAEPARAVRRALEQLLALQRDDDGSRSVADLVHLMNASDPEAVASAAGHVYAISRNDGSIASQELVDALFRVTKSGDLDATRYAVGALSHLSENEYGRMFIFRSGGLAEIIRMLRSPDESVVRYALTTLHRLLLHVDQSRPSARQLGATAALTSLLIDRPPKLLALAADSIHMLIFDDHTERNKFAIDLGGSRALIRLLTQYDNQPKVVYTAVRCVRALSAGQEAVHLKHSLIENDALRTLYSNLQCTTDSRTRIAILACLRNLSDAVSNEEDHAPLLLILLGMVRDSALAGAEAAHSEDEIIYACGVLSNLTCNNIHNKAAVCESEGIATLCDALRLRPSATDETVTEPALCALRHCTARHAHASHAQLALVRCGGWAMLLEQLRTLRPPVAKAALGVVRNAALMQENRASLVESPGRLGEQLAAISTEILASAAAELRVDVQAQSDDGVRMWELAEATAGALHQLAAHPTIALWILADPSLIHIVTEILESDEAFAADEVMQREMLGLVYQLTKCESGVAQVSASGIRVLAESCLRSPHYSVVTYASGVLRNIGGDATAAGGHGEGHSYGNPNWAATGMPGGAGQPAPAGSSRDAALADLHGGEGSEGYEPELFGYHNPGLNEENYGIDRIDQSFRLPHNNSDWFDTDL